MKKKRKKNAITNQQESRKSKVRTVALMLKFILDTLHVTGFFCETWPTEKAFENTNYVCNYVTVGSSGFYHHSWKPKEDLEMHFQMLTDHLHLCAPRSFNSVCPHWAHRFSPPLTKMEQSKINKNLKPTALLLYLLPRQTVSIFIQSLILNTWESQGTPLFL